MSNVCRGKRGKTCNLWKAGCQMYAVESAGKHVTDQKRGKTRNRSKAWGKTAGSEKVGIDLEFATDWL